MSESSPDKISGNPNADISAQRLAIDEIDEKMLDLINRRLLLSQQIGRFKIQGGIQIIDRHRENEILNRLIQKNSGPLADDGLRRIFSAIIAESRNVQKTDRGPND